jgi:hypothetical protein
MVKNLNSNQSQLEIHVGRYLWQLYVRGVLRPSDCYASKSGFGELSESAYELAQCIERILSGERPGITEGMCKIWRAAALRGRMVEDTEMVQGAGRFSGADILYQLIGREFYKLIADRQGVGRR